MVVVGDLQGDGLGVHVHLPAAAQFARMSVMSRAVSASDGGASDSASMLRTAEPDTRVMPRIVARADAVTPASSANAPLVHESLEAATRAVPNHL